MNTERHISIDILRGLAIFVMVLGNLSPDTNYTYAQLLHQEWTGINLIDTAFPTFIFVMGVSMAFANRLKYEGWLKKVVVRTIVLFILGLLVNHLPLLFTALFTPDYTLGQAMTDLISNFRPFGVLQRIALVYFVGSIIFQTITRPWPLFIIAFMLMLLSTIGYHLYNPAESFSQADNISFYIDQQLQGTAHNYLQGSYDPEGLYGTINATATLLLGCFAGLQLHSRQQFRLTTNKPGMKLFTTGMVLILIAWGWSQAEIISKPLWTAPYVLLMAGLDMILLSLLEGFSHKTMGRFLCHPLESMGRNPLFIYLLAEWGLALLFAIPYQGEPLYLQLYHTYFFSPDNPFGRTFIYTMMWDILFLLIAEIMYMKNIIIKI